MPGMTRPATARPQEDALLARPRQAALLTAGLDPKYGARELKRTIVRLVEQPLATLIVDEIIPDNSMVDGLLAKSGDLVFKAVRPK